MLGAIPLLIPDLNMAMDREKNILDLDVGKTTD